ncbi:MAG: hypothetical protein A2664_02765 [Candidatus Taylorbacteria bacterium RIFCSPHIGHO2_01_FULL_46_22b]|uniref:Uncharacterized protein n=1 Tax=Candidatus Taylorbacteria bacterium RIFCSPHIGHO2_01_FULL_46_22b TaxID=1802301 RepID=A0A1G2M3R6_9BACT|nr:MAG: hypothetical protein A2664_02765 [Candidatus Taylorbacteria bacterium RIFCSPHIGHO2_01_FULL_46_22b]
MPHQLNRSVYLLFLCLLVFFTPWWFVGIFVLVGCIYFESFYEALIAACLADLFFGPPVFLWGMPLLFTALTLLVLLGIPMAKRRLVFWKGRRV